VALVKFNRLKDYTSITRQMSLSRDIVKRLRAPNFRVYWKSLPQRKSILKQSMCSSDYSCRDDRYLAHAAVPSRVDVSASGSANYAGLLGRRRQLPRDY
jgi:hypothetical protein